MRQHEIKGRKETPAADAHKASGKSGVGGDYKGEAGDIIPWPPLIKKKIMKLY